MLVFERRVGARRVGVVDAQDEAAAGVAGEEEVVERGARRADVQRARRARREAYSHCLVEGYSCSSARLVSPANRSSLSPRLGMLAPRRGEPAGPPQPGRTECRTTSGRRRTSTPRCATAPSATRRSTRPGHKLGKGAPAGLREYLGDTCLAGRPRHGRRRGGHARVDGPHPPGRGLRRRGVGLGPHLVPRQRLHQRRPRPAAHAVRPRRHGHRAPQRRTSPCLRGSSSPGRRPCTWSRPSTRSGASRSRCAPPTRWRRWSGRRRLARCSSPRPPTTASAPTWRPSARSPTTPACRSSPTRPGARTCASAPSCRSTP